MKFLIVGLGNIGDKYQNTRHNIGFQIIDELAATAEAEFALLRHALFAEMKYRGKSMILIKPTTLMNRSGKAVSYWMQQEKIKPERMLIITDDLALSPGTLRMRPKGGDAGHNGMADIIQTLGMDAFPRLRFGLGNDFPRGYQSEYVLGEWSQEEMEYLPERRKLAVEMIQSFVWQGIQKTMNHYNNK